MTRRALNLCAMVFVLASAGWAQLTRLVSVDSAGSPANFSCFSPVISSDGRYVAFYSEADNLVPGDTNHTYDVFVHDRQTGVTERVSVGSNGQQAQHDSMTPSISADGRYVAFWSISWEFVPGDTNLAWDVFLHDRVTGSTTRVSAGEDGTEGNHESLFPTLSPDGRYVAFVSAATNLVVPDVNGIDQDILLHDRSTSALTRVSVGTGGVQPNDWSDGASLSFDGRFVAFRTAATNVVPGDTNGKGDVFVHDRETGETTRVSVATNGDQANDQSYAPSISADGRYVAFGSMATNLVPGDTNGEWDGFVRDRWTSTTHLVTLSSQGGQGNDQSNGPRISADGRTIVFGSWATNLVENDANTYSDVYVRDLPEGLTALVTIAVDGGPGNQYSSGFASPSADGRFVAFESAATNLIHGGLDGYNQIYVRDRRASGFTSLCEPGSEGVIDCPCANPPGASGRGCDNSAATGGAVLFASGIAYLASDALVFSTRGENPAAMSLLLQGNGSVSGGVVFGRGVRCVGGTIIRRLFTKFASGGSVTLPDLPGGDPTVSERSAEKGDVIQVGGSRWYLVYYRDVAGSGGCPLTSTFNATQTGKVEWSL